MLLAAHTHGGQVNIPLIGTPIIPTAFPQYTAGHVFENGHHLFVTTGIGTSIMPVRFRVTPEITMTDCCPACINDTAMAQLVEGVARRVVGPRNVGSSMRTMGADDMSLFLNAVPGCYFFVGSANRERGLNSPHHSPTFDFDERALDVGVQMLTSVALEFLERG